MTTYKAVVDTAVFRLASKTSVNKIDTMRAGTLLTFDYTEALPGKVGMFVHLLTPTNWAGFYVAQASIAQVDAPPPPPPVEPPPSDDTFSVVLTDNETGEVWKGTLTKQ